MLPSVHYGEADEQERDWRKLQKKFDDIDDDETLEITPKSVVEMLGFDPLDMEGGDEVTAADPGDDMGEPDHIVTEDELRQYARDASPEVSAWFAQMVKLRQQYHEDTLKAQREAIERAKRKLGPGATPADIAKELGLSPPAHGEPLDVGREVKLFGKPLSELQREAAFQDWARKKGISIPEFPGGRAKDADGVAKEYRTVHGLDIVIENYKGDLRTGKDYEVEMPAHYGFIRGVTGADGDSLDVYLGDGPGNGWVYVVDQRLMPPAKGFDEHKVMVNFPTMQAALDAYRAGHHRSKDVFMEVTPMPLDSFKQWMRTADLSIPCSQL